VDYVREHIKRYWGISYRRTLGIALITLSVALAIGLTFTILTGALALTNYYSYIFFWIILVIMIMFIFLSNFISSHVSTVKYMNEEEHESHSKYMAAWMISLVVGIIAFMIPLLLAKSYYEPMLLLFSFGGAFMVIYVTVVSIFKHRYEELAIGGVAFWIMFIIGITELSSNSQLNTLTKMSFSLYFAAMCITIITGFVGLALIFNSSKESMHEFVSSMEKISGKEKRKAPARRRRRR